MRLVTDLLLWLDQSPFRYWATAWGLYAVLVVLCLWPIFQRRSGEVSSRPWWIFLGSDWFFLLLASAVLMAFHWPIWFVPRSLNPDEATFLSEAITLQHDPVFWRSTSAGTSGPLNIYPLLLPSLFKFPFNYAAARVVADSCAIGAIIFVYLTVRRFAPPALARLSILPSLTFFSLTTEEDFLHYGSEHVPMFLLSAAFFLSIRLSDLRAEVSKAAFAAGCVLGAVPFAKLQGTLIALTIAAFSYFFLLTRNDPAKTKFRYCGWLTLGGLAVPCFFFSITAFSGAFEHFWRSYIVANQQYQGSGFALVSILGMVPVFGNSFYPYLNPLLLVGGLGIGAGLAWGWQNLEWNQHIRFLAFASAVLAVSYISVILPGWPWTHYFLLMAMPAAIWAFAAISFCLAVLNPPKTVAVLLLSALWCVIGVGWQVINLPHSGERHLGSLEKNLKAEPGRIAQVILRFASPGESLAVWGWFNDPNVETGMTRATTDVYFEYLRNYNGFIPDYFKNLYMADVCRANPPVFVDAISPAIFDFGDRADSGFETFPPLAKYVCDNYTEVEDLRGIRIFVRNDRLKKTVALHPEFLAGQFPPCNNLALPAGTNENTIDRTYVLRTLGRVLSKSGKTNEAFTVCKRILKINPSSAYAYYELGRLLLHADQLNEAVTCFQKAVEIRTNYAAAQGDLGIALVHNGQVDEGLGHIRKSLEIQPDDPETYAQLGGIFWKAGQLNDAVTCFNRALRLDPDFADIHCDLGYTLFLQSHLKEAKAHLERALEIKPDLLLALDTLAWVLATSPEPSLRDGAKAVELAERANQLSQNKNPTVLQSLAAAYAEAGRFPEAVAAARRSLACAKDPALRQALAFELGFYLTDAPYHQAGLGKPHP